MVARAAFAQPTPQCVEGKAATEATLWHCCWPGQSWSDQMDRCVGPPQCPPDLVPEEAECVRRVVPTVYVPPPRHAAAQKNSLLVAGGALFGISYGATLVMGAYGSWFAATTPLVHDVPTFNNHLAAQLTWNFIPVVGPAIACARYASVKEFQFTTADGELWSTRSDSVALVCAGEIAGLALQVTGLALLGAGAAQKRRAAARAWNLTPLVGGGRLGLGLAGAF